MSTRKPKSNNIVLLGIPLIGIVATIALFITVGAQIAIPVLISFVILLFIYITSIYTVVPSNEIHVVAGLGKEVEYRGGDAYNFIPVLMRKSKVPLSVIEIQLPKIKLLDTDNLPFAVEISCKVKVNDAIVAVKSLNHASAREITPIVDDTIQAAARSEAMKQSLPDIMRERDEMEMAINKATAANLRRVGIELVLFDIKNIIDAEGYTVIQDMERVKSAELNRQAREAEANQNAQAEITEATKRAEAEVQRQDALLRSETARLNQEKQIAEQKRELTLREMDVINAETRRQAEIEAERINIQAEADAERLRKMAAGDADSQLIRAKADAESMKVRAEADAESIRLKLEAEAQGTAKLADALKAFNAAGIKVKLAEINAQAQSEIASSIARGIQNNTKLILPSGDMGGFFTNLVTGITAMKESGVSLEDAVKKS